jgi:hypothetical protein
VHFFGALHVNRYAPSGSMSLVAFGVNDLLLHAEAGFVDLPLMLLPAAAAAASAEGQNVERQRWPAVADIGPCRAD